MSLPRFALWICLVAAGTPTRADELSSNEDRPYRLAVCLHFSDDPIFTRFFTRSVRQEVHDQLANYFGELVELDVVSEHPLLERVETAGLADLAVSADEFEENDWRDKLFLATIDFASGLYRVEWRQLDGDVERIGPLRSRTTADRAWLAKAICLAVKEQFAPVALVEPKMGGTRADLRFQGAGRGPRLSALLAEGCVLQPYWVIRKPGGALSRVPIPYTVLRIEPGESFAQATVVSSLGDPWKRTARVAGFQAIKLSTCSGRFRLRLVDAQSGSPVLTCQVYANTRGFRKMSDGDRLEAPDRHGNVVAPRPFADLAYIEIQQSGGSVSRILLPITDAWCDELCKLRVETQAAEKDDWRRRLAVLVSDVQALEGMLDQHVRDLNQLNEKKQYEPALERVRAAVASLDPLLKTARRDAAGLRARAESLQLGSDERLAWILDQVEEVDGRVEDLRQMDTALGATIERVEAGKLAAVRAKMAENLVEQGDIDQAIANYRQAVKLSPESGFDKRLDELEETWRIKDDDHRKARTFVFEVWPEARVAQLETLFPEARNAFEKLARVDDHLTARRLLKKTGEHLQEVSELAEMLMLRTTEADRQDREKYGELFDQMFQFQLEVGAYLENRRPGAPPPGAPAPAAPEGEEPVAGGRQQQARPELEEEEEVVKEEVEEQELEEEGEP